MQRSGFYNPLLGPVSDHGLKSRVSKGRALHQVIKYSPGAIWQIEAQLTQTTNCCQELNGYPKVWVVLLKLTIDGILIRTPIKAIAGKELSLSSWCIASLYIYHFLTVVDFSSEKYSGSTGHRNSLYQQKKITVRMPVVRPELATPRL